MGEQKVSLLKGKKQMHKFVKQLLQDVKALEYMLEHEWFEDDIIRIGAEQEMCLVNNKSYKPAPLATEALDLMKDLEWVETELARFNLEIGLDPLVFKGKCLSQMEAEINMKLDTIRDRIKDLDTEIILTGILPTLQKFDLGMHNLTPVKRYFALMEAINKQQAKGAYELRISGLDEFLVKHDSPLLEACNTSFQVHLQVSPNNFKQMYNISLALAAPVMAIASNSPVVFGKRLWHETRIALFQQSLDTRTMHDHMRERSPRVNFGNGWLENDILDIYKEDIARFRVLISGDIEEDSFQEIKKGKVPKLRALQVHNSTVYRWNRPCYGISDTGKPHLRIENRVLASGPTVADEMANAAFWLGLMIGMADKYDDITEHLSFEDVRDNFGKAARFGIDTKFSWIGDKKVTAVDLIREELIPLAKAGLKKMKINKDDAKRYMDIIQGRCDKHMNGARWMLRSYNRMRRTVTENEAVTALTAAIIENQKGNTPIHKWDIKETSNLKTYRPSKLRVEEFMDRDLFTVQPDDLIDLVADMMDWRKLRYTPVEDENGQLVGLVSSRILLRHFTQKSKGNLNGSSPTSVREIMKTDMITVTPETTLLEALAIMKDKKIGSLLVVKDKELMGILTETEFLRITGRLMRRLAEEEEGK